MEWIKTNLIIILSVVIGVMFLFGSLGTLYYKHKADSLAKDLAVSQANLATCKTANDAWTLSNDVRNKAAQANLDRAEKAEDEAARLRAEARKNRAGPDRKAVKLRDFTPSANAKTDCDKEHEAIDEFFRLKAQP